jgi:hypothetical protein
VAEGFAAVEQPGQKCIAYAEVVNPDRGVDQDHRAGEGRRHWGPRNLGRQIVVDLPDDGTAASQRANNIVETLLEG